MFDMSFFHAFPLSISFFATLSDGNNNTGKQVRTNTVQKYLQPQQHPYARDLSSCRIPFRIICTPNCCKTTNIYPWYHTHVHPKKEGGKTRALYVPIIRYMRTTYHDISSQYVKVTMHQGEKTHETGDHTVVECRKPRRVELDKSKSYDKNKNSPRNTPTCINTWVRNTIKGTPVAQLVTPRRNSEPNDMR